MFVNVPIGAATVLLSLKYLPRSKGLCVEKRLDLPGSLTATSGIILFVYALTNAANEGFTSLATVLSLSLSILVLVGFLVIESRSKAPLVPLRFLKRPTVLSANVLTLIVAGASGGLGFIITIYLQQVLGYSALETGLAFLPSAVVFLVVGGWGSSRLVNRFGAKRTLIFSMSFVVLGNVLLSFVSDNASFLVVEPGAIMWALGASVGFPALFIIALSGIKSGEEGLASGIITTSQRVGFPLGLAVLVTVASSVSLQPMGAQDASPALIVLGFRYAFLAAAIMSAVGLAIAFLIKGNNPNPKTQVIGS